MEERLDYGTLLEYTHTGALAEDSVDTSTVVTYGTDEGYQIEKLWIYPPFSVGGVLENLTIQILVDGETVDLVHLHSSNYPPYLSNSKWLGIPLGIAKSNNPIENTCLKGNKKIQVRAIGGKGGVTGDFKVKLMGTYFKGDAAVVRLLGATFNPVPATFFDVQRNKSVTVSRPTPCSISALSNMSGGAPKAERPRILPYVAFAWNALATTPNEPYSYALDEFKVAKDWEDFKWNLGANEAVLITNIGVSEVTHSKELWIEVADLEYPKNHFDIRQYTNELPFSNFDTEQPLREYNILLMNEKGVLKVKDDGTLIGAGTLLVGIWGKKFEL